MLRGTSCLRKALTSKPLNQPPVSQRRTGRLCSENFHILVKRGSSSTLYIFKVAFSTSWFNPYDVKDARARSARSAGRVKKVLQ